MTTISFLDLKKKLKKISSNLSIVKVGLLGDSATQLLALAIKGMAIDYKLNIDLFEADYNQIEQQVLDPSSVLYEHHPELVIICKSTEALEMKFLTLDSNQKIKFAERQLENYEQIIGAIQAKLPHTKIICFNFPISLDLTFGHFGLITPLAFRYQLQLLNSQLMQLGSNHGNVFLFDIVALQTQYGYRTRIDQKFYIKANQVFALDFLPIIAKHLLDIIGAIRGTHLNKCLILDLDNTMWGGVIGDDGIKKIELGDLGTGKAFTNLQKWAKSLKDRGIILCICSKNTEEIAKNAFRNHPDMVLQIEDVAVFMANWENKADNIRYIQQVLNINFDSMVFLDDNPFERNLVRKELPQVTVPELPEDPAEYLAYLRTLNLFETVSVSKEDGERTKMYQQEAKRSLAKASYKSIDEYLEQLQMLAICKPFDEFSIPRISQLTQRSNQFNLRTIRYSEGDIKNIKENHHYLTLSVQLLDKYGDYGLVSLLIGNIQENDLFIDTWIMSCRVLKRGLEKFLLNQLVCLCKEKGIKNIIGEWLETKKNIIVKDHYKNLGFKKENNLWLLDVSQYKPQKNSIKLLDRMDK